MSVQTRVTTTSGRMSRRDAYDALQTILAIANTFPGHREAEAIIVDTRAYLAELDTMMPAKVQILSLQESLNVLVSQRLRNSATIRPMTSPAITVYLFGAQSSLFSATEEAAALAASQLNVSPDELRLVDHTPVSTATWTGARYTFRVRAAWDPAEAPSAAAAAL